MPGPRMLRLSPTAAVIRYHILSGLRQHTCEQAEWYSGSVLGPQPRGWWIKTVLCYQVFALGSFFLNFLPTRLQAQKPNQFLDLSMWYSRQ